VQSTWIQRRDSSRTGPLFALIPLLLCACSAGEKVNEASRDLVAAGEPAIVFALAAGPALLQPDEDYLLGPSDVLVVSLLDIPTMGEMTEVSLEVSAGGAITLPVIGAVEVGGLSAPDCQVKIAEAARAYVLEPFVAVRVEDYRSRRIAVLGALIEPGVKYLQRNRVSINEALALAGGLSMEAGLRAMVAHAGSEEPQIIDLEALARGDLTQNVWLSHGDVLQVLEPERFFVAGYVEEPGEFALRRRTTVLQAISLAGGLQIPDASPSMTRIRRSSSRGEQIIEVDLEAIAADEAPDVELVAGDLLEVRQGTGRFVLVGLYDFLKGVFNVGVGLASPF
jgi:polysaccharide biosynthesis/export protein